MTEALIETTTVQLVPVFTADIGGKSVQACDARVLHTFLESKQLFANWIKDRIEKYDFQENQDFIFALEIYKAKNDNRGGHNRTDYHLTLGTAKELAMVENNAKGREVRRYFIAMEQKALATPPALNPANLSRLQLIELAMQAEQERVQLERQVDTMKPAVKALERLSGGEGDLCITDAAKTLKVAPKWFFSWLQLQRWIYRRTGGKHWLGYQDKVQSGFLSHKVTTLEKPDGTEKIIEQVLVTPTGLTKLSDLLNKPGSFAQALPC